MLPPASFAQSSSDQPRVQQLREERRITGHVGQPVGHVGAAVEVAAQPDVLDPGHLADVLDVGGHVSDRGPRRRIGRRALPAGRLPQPAGPTDPARAAPCRP